MAQGKPTKWVTAKLSEEIPLSKRIGIEIIIWKKWHHTRRGTVKISVGGIRWFPFKAQKGRFISWDKLADMLEGK